MVRTSSSSLHTSSLPAERIAVIAYPGGIGDVLCQLPFLRALRAAYPEAHISWLTDGGPSRYPYSPVHELTATCLDAALEHLSLGRHTADLWKPRHDFERFCLVLDLRSRWRPALIARWRVPHRYFLSYATNYLFSDRKPRGSRKPPVHGQERMLQLVELASGKKADTGKISLPDMFIETWRPHFTPGISYVGFVPGAGDKRKIWPLENYLAVANQLQAQGHVPAFILGPQETDLQEAILAQCPQALFPLQALAASGIEPQLEHTIALAGFLSIVVTNDNGTSHMLAAGDSNMVSLFGRTSWRKLAPKVSHGTVVASEFFGSDAITDIPVDAVISAVNALLAKHP